MKATELTSKLALESKDLEIKALEERLEMTYEQRIEAHENARILMEELKAAGEGLRAKSQRTS